MFGRFGRRRTEAPAAEQTGDEPPEAATADLLSLVLAVETSARHVYSRHGLPQRRGHYRRPAEGGAWELLGEGLTPAEKWALIADASDSGGWRYAAYEALGAHSEIPIVRQASAILAACQGLRQRLADRAVISPQDLADSLRLGEAWRRLTEDVSHEALATAPLHFLPPDED